jgi:hypothetical protein
METISTPREVSTARLTSRKGWFKVWKADVALLSEQCGDSSPWVKVVWLALLQIQNDRQSSEFEVPIGLIKSLAGVSRSTAKRAIQQLIALGFLKVEAQKIPGKKEHNVNRYRLLRSVPREPTGVGSDRTERSVLDERSSESQFLNNSLPKKEERVKQRSSQNNARAWPAQPPSASQGGATGASGAKKTSKADSWRTTPGKANHS